MDEMMNGKRHLVLTPPHPMECKFPFTFYHFLFDGFPNTAVHPVPELVAGGVGDEAEGSLDVVLVHDVERVEDEEGRGEEKGGQPDREENHLGVALARSVAERPRDPCRGW